MASVEIERFHSYFASVGAEGDGSGFNFGVGGIPEAAFSSELVDEEVEQMLGDVQ